MNQFLTHAARPGSPPIAGQTATYTARPGSPPTAGQTAVAGRAGVAATAQRRGGRHNGRHGKHRRTVILAVALSLIGGLTQRAIPLVTAAGAGDVTPPSLVFALEWSGPNTPIHDVILLWDDRLDQANLPDVTDFDVRLQPGGVSVPIDTVEFTHDGTFDPSLSLAFMTLFLRDPVALPATITVSYAPGAHPIRDASGNLAAATTDFAVAILEVETFAAVIGLVDGFYAADHVGLVFSDAVDPASIPAPSAFTVTRNGTPMTPTSVSVFPKFGGRILDLTLPVGFRSGDEATISYAAPGGGGIRNLVGTAAPDFPTGPVFLLLAAQDQAYATTPSAGGSVSTDAGAAGTTAQDPVATTVGVPGAATVVIDEGAANLPPPTSDYTFIGETVEISVDPPATPGAPIAIDFAIDASVLAAAGATPATVGVFRNGLLVAPCADASGIASPDPCVLSRVAVPAPPALLAYAVLRVLTSQASTWNFGTFIPYTWSGFRQPVDNLPTVNLASAGRAIPVKFMLGGDRGLNIFRAAYPKSTSIDCMTAASTDPVEFTVAAGSSSLTYDPLTGTYTYVWKTDRAWSKAPGGPCRKLVLAFRDGSTREALFRFR